MHRLTDLLGSISRLRLDAEAILSTHESANARVATLEASYSRLDEFSLKQDELFRESLRAVENRLYRAAHVLAWAGFIDFLHNYLTTDGATGINALRPKWSVKKAEDLRDQSDYAVIEAGKLTGFYGKTVMKAIHGLLNKRNECAHPSDFYPDFNETLGYISELFHRMDYLRKNS